MPYPELNVHTIIVPQANNRSGSSPPPLPDYFQSILDNLNICGLPQTKDSTLTTEIRQNALAKYHKLVCTDAVKVIHKLAAIRFNPSQQRRAGEYWDGSNLALSHTYLKKKYDRDVLTEFNILSELGLISYTEQTKGRCRKYQVIDIELLEAYSQPIEIETKKVWVNLPVSKKSDKPTDIARQAGKNIPFGIMNLKAVANYFHEQFKVASGYKLENLLLELSYVLRLWVSQERYDADTGYLIYKQSFHTTPTGGRKYAASGDQFISKGLKAYWFDLENVFNYDFVGCHIHLFNYYVKHTTFATNWVSNPGFKQALADKIGIPIDLLKQSVLAITFGGKPTAYSECEIFQLFSKHFKDYDLAKYHLDLFKTETLEYQTAIDTWLAEIRATPKAYQRNALGLKTDKTKPQTLASHWLVGLEQSMTNWISSLTNQRRGGYQVISDQFDGIVTIGKIPAELIEAIRVRSGLSLVEKPFN